MSIVLPSQMSCPHCGVSFFYQPRGFDIGKEKDLHNWTALFQRCPTCRRAIVEVYCSSGQGHGNWGHYPLNSVHYRILAYPKMAYRRPPSPDVPPNFAQDYAEACLVLADSPKASAALSRRCLQNILRDHFGIKERDLAKEIEAAIAGKIFPGHIADSIDAIRNVGNFAAHPLKSTASGEILEVEPGEAEWNLDVLETIFDFAFVEPAETKRKRAALNKKLQDAGKPPMK